MYDIVQDQFITLPDGWVVPDPKCGDIHGPKNQIIQITGPTGRWAIRGVRRRYYRSALAAINASTKARV